MSDITQSGIYIATPHIPPPVSAAYRNRTAKDKNAKYGRIRTDRYHTWEAAFQHDVRNAMKSKEMISGPYAIIITIDQKVRRSNADIMNREKVVSDALQRGKVILNDSKCESGTVRWGDANGGMTVEVLPL